ncbi:MAG: PDZ domain-containing protein [Rhodospirillaceae bacterium]|jgi:hypothetical protein|nr:PDZ domain-containing protein [Rhodospirillaceae bacterium]MBT4489568.1 PDZ domain-containing protein [Rhodospirillaceae bacterium]MBT5193877.1 PDZ domain-containing protein [Rhodospirillaceae bacterium]MBT5896852.1 PDZ domain-containing protein [Rhodospirillaceae bacterium]MBT6426087.1 PDZ domain-containing protein [Rhodospirillaceae bacterium]
MADEMKKDNLFRHMAHMVALEADVQQSLQPLLTNAHPGIAALAAQIQSSTSGQGPALAARLADVAGDDIPNAEFEDPLGHLHRTVIETLIGYSKMQVLARRYAHGSPTPEGATDDLGHQNSANHIKAFQDIYQLLHDVMLWELDHDGHSCQCPYPCCSHGICLCAVSSRAVQRGAWGDGEAVKEAGVFVHSPPPDSAAGKAGLRHGDVVVAADGQDVDVFSTLQGVVRDHASGEAINLSVRRGSDSPEEFSVVRN